MKNEFKLTHGSESWSFVDVDASKVKSITERSNLNKLLAKLLLSVGLSDDLEQIQAFTNSDPDLIFAYDGLSDPEHLERALDLLENIVNEGKKVFVNGDPDADGITATSIIVAGLLFLGVDVQYDFPIRAKEGHGLQLRLIDEAKRTGVDVIITTDCGTKDCEAVDYANQCGVPVIITDHHILGNVLPSAYAIVNPYLIKDKTPYQKLCGAGVAFKFMMALADRLETSFSEELYEFLLAMAALGTLSDRMSLLEPMNRSIVRDGIAAFNDLDLPGVNALREISFGGVRRLSPRKISRTVSPRLNAPGRIGDRDEGIPDSRMVVNMLIMGIEGVRRSSKKGLKKYIKQFLDVIETERNAKGGQVDKQAELVEDVNDARRKITEKIENEIEHILAENEDLDTQRIIIVKGAHWNSGVIGIDTDRLRDRFKRPAVIVTEQGDSEFLKGSARSVPLIDVYSVMEQVQESFSNEFGRELFQIVVDTESGSEVVNAFGGHSQACGFSFHKDDYVHFERLVREKMALLSEEQFIYSYPILEELQFSQINSELLSRLDKLEPYGQHFEYPLFILKSCRLGRKLRPFGNKYQTNRTPHIEFHVCDGKVKKKKTSQQLRYILCVGFGLFEKFQKLVGNKKDNLVDIIFSLDRMRGGKRSQRIQLMVEDIRVSESQKKQF